MAVKKPLVNYNGQIGELQIGDSLSGGGSGSTFVTANITIDFGEGSTGGTNIVSTVVTDATLLSTDNIEVYMNGLNVSADHNAYEHMLSGIYIKFSLSSFTEGVGFTVTAISEQRMSGKFQATYKKSSI